MPNMYEILLKLEGFQYAASLDLNMGYNDIRLSEDTSIICTNILPKKNIIKIVYQWE